MNRHTLQVLIILILGLTTVIVGLTYLPTITDWIVRTVGSMGYLGVMLLMALESSFFPFPSEVIIPPAGYLAAQGEMNLTLVILLGIIGSLLGALFNYWISMTAGRQFFERYGRLFLVSTKTLEKAERFFTRHGHVSTFVGRLLPGIRQYISLPAGIARMPLIPFSIWTSLGAGIWVTILALLGYWIGNHGNEIHQWMHKISIGLVIICMFVIGLYVFTVRRSRQKTP
ncbi:MAG: DedA family protein [Dethiosulfovibrio peptidovorans]|nr:MAG: DedA family protein [Dethiosulfovibrio peptidovorans]